MTLLRKQLSILPKQHTTLEVYGTTSQSNNMFCQSKYCIGNMTTLFYLNVNSKTNHWI